MRYNKANVMNSRGYVLKFHDDKQFSQPKKHVDYFVYKGNHNNVVQRNKLYSGKKYDDS